MNPLSINTFEQIKRILLECLKKSMLQCSITQKKFNFPYITNSSDKSLVCLEEKLAEIVTFWNKAPAAPSIDEIEKQSLLNQINAQNRHS